MKSRIHKLLFQSDLEATRFLLAMGAIFIGMGLLWPTLLGVTVESLNLLIGDGASGALSIPWVPLSVDAPLNDHAYLEVFKYSFTPIEYKPFTIFPTPEQLALGTGRHTYSLMAGMMPETMWGCAFLFQGCLMMYSLLFEKCTPLFLWLDAFMGMVLWTVSISSCYLAYWGGWVNITTYRPPAIMGGEVAAALASWWVFVRYSCEPHQPCRKEPYG